MYSDTLECRKPALGSPVDGLDVLGDHAQDLLLRLLLAALLLVHVAPQQGVRLQGVVRLGKVGIA